jgi:penicillin-binding protein 1A
VVLINKQLKRAVLMTILAGTMVGVVVVVGIGVWIVNTTPDISDYQTWHLAEGTVVYSGDGEKVLTEFQQDNKAYVQLEKVPSELEQAVIAIEDARYRGHIGIDPIGILRAIWVNLKHLAPVQGASTITQQLARNVLLTREKRISRKLREIYLALQFEKMYTKEEILEFYLNEIFMGHGVYGMQGAAKFYFDKQASELTLSESALLAGIIRGPNYYSPYNHLDRARSRRDLVLEQMVEQGYITKEQALEAKEAPIDLAPSAREERKVNSYFIRYVRRQLLAKFGANRVYREGLKVYTTLSSNMQQAAAQTIKEAEASGVLPTVDRETGQASKQPQLAFVTIEPETAYIKAMIGGRGNDRFNRATQAYRQVGSAFKPIIYTAALNQGYSPGSIIDDSLQEYQGRGEETWLPTNYDDKYRGPTTLRTGLAKSINVLAV